MKNKTILTIGVAAIFLMATVVVIFGSYGDNGGLFQGMFNLQQFPLSNKRKQNMPAINFVEKIQTQGPIPVYEQGGDQIMDLYASSSSSPGVSEDEKYYGLEYEFSPSGTNILYLLGNNSVIDGIEIKNNTAGFENDPAVPCIKNTLPDFDNFTCNINNSLKLSRDSKLGSYSLVLIIKIKQPNPSFYSSAYKSSLYNVALRVHYME